MFSGGSVSVVKRRGPTLEGQVNGPPTSLNLN